MPVLCICIVGARHEYGAICCGSHISSIPPDLIRRTRRAEAGVDKSMSSRVETKTSQFQRMTGLFSLSQNFDHDGAYVELYHAPPQLLAVPILCGNYMQTEQQNILKHLQPDISCEW